MPWLGDGTRFVGYRTADAGIGRYGNGNDGTIVIGTTAGYTSDPFNLVRDLCAANLTVPYGKTINTSGYRIFVQQVLTVATTAVIHCSGSNAVGATAGVGDYFAVSGSLRRGTSGGIGVNGAGNNGGGGVTSSYSIGALGGNGGAGTNAAGTSGSLVSASANNTDPHDYVTGVTCCWLGSGSVQTYAGGGGGGAGGGSGAAAGGGGGAGGGIVIISAHHIANDGSIHARGGTGAAGTATNCGGGGGGGGGACIVVADYYTGTGSIDALGGNPGASGGGTGVAGSTGSNGNTYNFFPVPVAFR